VKDILHIDISAVAEIDIDLRPHKLLDQQRQIETVGVESAEIAPLDELLERPCHLTECRAVLHILIGDVVNGRCLFRDRNRRIDTPSLDYLLAIWHNLDQRDFDYAVARCVHARGLQIEEYNRAFEFQIHIASLPLMR